MKEEIEEVCKAIDIYTTINYFPILKYTGFGVEVNQVLSYVMGWNLTGRPCFVSMEKLTKLFDISEDEAYKIVEFLLEKKVITSVEVAYKTGKSKGYEVDMRVLKVILASNYEYKKEIRINAMKKELEKLKKEEKTLVAKGRKTKII